MCRNARASEIDVRSRSVYWKNDPTCSFLVTWLHRSTFDVAEWPFDEAEILVIGFWSEGREVPGNIRLEGNSFLRIGLLWSQCARVGSKWYDGDNFIFLIPVDSSSVLLIPPLHNLYIIKSESADLIDAKIKYLNFY